jgi:hypothetical protein
MKQTKKAIKKDLLKFREFCKAKEAKAKFQLSKKIEYVEIK